MMGVKIMVCLQRRVTRNAYGKKFYNHYLTVPNSLVDTLDLKPGATFESSSEDGRIIYTPVIATCVHPNLRNRQDASPIGRMKIAESD